MAVIDNAVISGNSGSDIVPKGYHWNFTGKSLSEVKSAGGIPCSIYFYYQTYGTKTQNITVSSSSGGNKQICQVFVDYGMDGEGFGRCNPNTSLMQLYQCNWEHLKNITSINGAGSYSINLWLEPDA